jgi:hypothetical protein
MKTDVDGELRRVGWAIVQELYMHAPAVDRPRSWEDLPFTQEWKVLCAAHAALIIAREAGWKRWIKCMEERPDESR